ncbi:MAG: aromatic aminobenezylarsenical efflux permease ArsG family transporter [Candidatus Nanoarchaeia archaeon]
MSIINFIQVMSTGTIPILAAFFIGLMTAISPCPLAANITAIAYISGKTNNKKNVLLVGIIYTLGRMFIYVLLAALIVWFGLNVQATALVLQKYGDKLLGPFLIILGLLLLNIIKVKRFKNSEKFSRFKEKLANKGYLGSFLLGAVLALAFCPFSAVLFFGMLIPLAISSGDGIIIPGVFAIATGLPVIIFSLILVYGANKVGAIMKKVKKIEEIIRKSAAVIIIAIGLYYLITSFI